MKTVEVETNVNDENVFVYGSLRRTEMNNEIMRSAGGIFLGEDRITADKVETGYPFPAIKEGLGLVEGELFAVNKLGLMQLDFFEGHPNFYRRQEVTTYNGMKAWVYYGNEILA